MRNEEEINIINERIKTILEEERALAPKIKRIGDYCGAFAVTNEGGIDETFQVELNGVEFYDEDGQGYAMCDDFYGDKADEVVDKLSLDLHTFVDPVEDVDLPELTPEQSLALKRERTKSVALARAALLMDINVAINESLFSRIEERLHALEKEFEGLVYEDWEEIQLNFTIDGERYYMYAWDGELQKRDRPLRKPLMEDKTL